MNLSMHTIILVYTRNYSRSWVHWRHCRAAAGSCIIVIRWRPWLHWTGCFSCQRSSVQWTHARCVSVTSDLSSVFNEKLLADPAVGDSFSEIKLKVRREALRLFHFTKLNLNFVKPLERVLCVLCAGEPIAPSQSALHQHFNMSHFSSPALQQQQPPQHLVVLLELWLHLHPVTTTASRKLSEFCCVTKARSIILILVPLGSIHWFKRKTQPIAEVAEFFILTVLVL